MKEYWCIGILACKTKTPAKYPGIFYQTFYGEKKEAIEAAKAKVNASDIFIAYKTIQPSLRSKQQD